MRVPPATGSASVADRDKRTGGPNWRARLARSIARERRRGAATDATRPPTELALAIERDELRLAYQPKVRLRSRRVAGVEALVRWEHPERGTIAPNDFVPAAEKSNDILALTLWVIDRAIRDQRALAGRGHELTVFVNIAAALLADDGFITDACDRITRAGAAIGLEITETSVIRDPGAAIANLNRAAGHGIPIAIDDYGAGLSSLAYLKQLPACELKIDKLFITELTSSNRDPLIVRSTIDLAHAMEMEVVAEGVESEAALALLSVMGCDMAQGYHIGRPVSLDDLVVFLDRHRDGWAADADAAPISRFPAALRRA